MKNENDVVVTGLGVVSPIGVGLEAFTDSLLNKASGIRARELFDDTSWPFRIGGIIEDFDPKLYVKPRKSLKLMCREIQFGFGAARLALDDSGLDVEAIDPTRIGVVCGSDTFYCDPNSIADSYWLNDESITDLSTWIQQALKTIEPLWMLKYLPNMIASHIAISIDAQGPNNSLIQGDISGILAMIEAADVIRRGWTDVMVTGGTGSKINPTYLSYHGIKELAEPGDDPTQACRPFDKNRTGTVGGEGAGMMVLERRKHAEARGAEIYATLAGFEYGHAPTDRESQIELISRCINQSIDKSSFAKDQVSNVNSYGSGEVESDSIVAQAIHQTLNGIGVTAYKGNFGNLGPAGAMIEVSAMIQSLRTNVVPPTINCESLDPGCPVNVITETEESQQTAAVKLSNSNTGQQAAVLFAAE